MLTLSESDLVSNSFHHLILTLSASDPVSNSFHHIIHTIFASDPVSNSFRHLIGVNRQLRLDALNIRSVNQNTDDVRDLFDTHHLDILALSET